MDFKAYKEDAGNHCVKCGSANVSAGEFESDFDAAWRVVTCCDCGKEILELFTLTGVEEVNRA